MTSNTLPVVAAIPNYNMAASLRELLPQLAEQEYAGIYVLDDASTDESREVVEESNADVEFVAGHENVGAGSNRNRILGALGHEAIIHFIDADMHLETERVPELAQEVFGSNNVSMVGGLIKEKNGRQHPFNFGPRQCLRSDIGAVVQWGIYFNLDSNPAKAAGLREKHQKLLQDYPDLQAEPVPRQIFWNAEANLLIRSNALAAVGGFNPKLRNHEIQDLAIKLKEAGTERRFDPALSAVHKAIQVRKGNRNLQMAKAEFQVAKVHGFSNWLLPDGSFKPSL